MTLPMFPVLDRPLRRPSKDRTSVTSLTPVAMLRAARYPVTAEVLNTTARSYLFVRSPRLRCASDIVADRMLEPPTSDVLRDL